MTTVIFRYTVGGQKVFKDHLKKHTAVHTVLCPSVCPIISTLKLTPSLPFLPPRVTEEESTATTMEALKARIRELERQILRGDRYKCLICMVSMTAHPALKCTETSVV